MSNVSVGDYGNNALDLVANALGATVGIALVWWYEHGQEAHANTGFDNPL